MKQLINKTKKPEISKAMHYVSKRVGEAIHDYNMIEDGDKIMIAVSGGKDSMSLIKLLKYRQTFAPVNYEIIAVHIDAGIPDFPVNILEEYFKKEEVKYVIEKIDFLQGKKWEDINCFWCSWNRRKALFNLADKLGCNKIAFGHHLDDIVETILLNMFWHGEISAMCPNQEMFKGALRIIRPLAYENEKAIKKMVTVENVPVIDQYNCPHNETSKRFSMKQFVRTLERENPAVKKNIFNSLKKIRTDYLT